MRVVQLTDTHLLADSQALQKGVATTASLQGVLTHLQSQPVRPDLLLLTGDVSQDESPQSYDRLVDLLTPLAIPAYWIPGNHDHPVTMAQCLDRPPLRSAKCLHQGGWQILLLDSSCPGAVGGYLSEATLDWLDSQLQACPLPTLVALHHPPCSVNSAWADAIALENQDEFLARLRPYPHLRLVIFGHIHQEFQAHQQGITFLAAPSTCVQFKPNVPTFALDDLPPGYRWLDLYPDGTWATGVEWVSLTG
ncbi:3',5'-cyclic-AMP phosphodiesterase [Trichothermofontia sp.]